MGKSNSTPTGKRGVLQLCGGEWNTTWRLNPSNGPSGQSGGRGPEAKRFSPGLWPQSSPGV